MIVVEDLDLIAQIAAVSFYETKWNKRFSGKLEIATKKTCKKNLTGLNI